MGLANAARSPTAWNLASSIFTMSLCAMAISKIPKKDRKGFVYSFIVLVLIIAIGGILMNLWKLAQEQGGAAYMQAMKNKMFQAKVAAPATNVGTVAVTGPTVV